MAACCSAEMEKTVTKNIRNNTNPVFIFIWNSVLQFRLYRFQLILIWILESTIENIFKHFDRLSFQV